MKQIEDTGPQKHKFISLDERGEIITMLTIATIVTLGIVTIVTSTLLNSRDNKQTTSTKAMVTDDGG